jgi:hypothetical protein
LKDGVAMKTFEELMTLSPDSPYCVFTYYCDNLGDHIQTLALLQHVTPGALLLRDHLTPHPDACLVANGWLTYGDMPNRNDFGDIRYAGVHLAPHCRNEGSVKALKECGTIGCRDSATMNFLSANGVSARLSGCATLTFPTYTGTRKGICCVDVSDEVREKVLQTYSDAIFLSHDLDPFELGDVDDNAIMEQYRQAYALLRRYMTAELVITSRVHATLPSIAFGTPAIYVGVPKEIDDRVTVLDGTGVRILDGERDFPSLDLSKPLPIDAAPFRERYLAFLRQSLGVALKPSKMVGTSWSR